MSSKLRSPRISAEALRREVSAWAGRLRVEPAGVYVQRMTKKWGSCSSRGRLCFAADLLGERRRFRNIVVVHELLHLAVPNHGKLFKSLMNAYLPGWQSVSAGKAKLVCGHGPLQERVIQSADRGGRL